MSELPPERKPDELSARDKAAEAAPDMPGGSRTFFYARATGAPRLQLPSPPQSGCTVASFHNITP